MNPQNNPYAKNAGNFIDYETGSTAAASPLAQTAACPASDASLLLPPVLPVESHYTFEYSPECCLPK
jgi:hypothetical protein